MKHKLILVHCLSLQFWVGTTIQLWKG